MNETLQITNLHARAINGPTILDGVTLTVKQGEIHAIMGPNGGGKSTLAQVLMGHPAYEITEGEVTLGGTPIIGLSPDKRAKLGLFLGFQYPVEVAGVNFGSFLRMAMNEQKTPGEKALSPIAFRNALEPIAESLGFSKELAKRSLNQDFSGGEKKKAEMLQLAMLKPKFAILDEPDSGLDVDALRHIARAINDSITNTGSNIENANDADDTNASGHQETSHPMGLILITHYQRILSEVKPDFVHIMLHGKIVKSGDASLAAEIERTGYDSYRIDTPQMNTAYDKGGSHA